MSKEGRAKFIEDMKDWSMDQLEDVAYNSQPPGNEKALAALEVIRRRELDDKEKTDAGRHRTLVKLTAAGLLASIAVPVTLQQCQPSPRAPATPAPPLPPSPVPEQSPQGTPVDKGKESSP